MQRIKCDCSAEDRQHCQKCSGSGVIHLWDKQDTNTAWYWLLRGMALGIVLMLIALLIVKQLPH